MAKINIKINGKPLDLSNLPEFEEHTNLHDIARHLGITNPCVVKTTKNSYDLSHKLGDIDEKDDLNFFDFDSPEGKHVYWHTSAHVLAQAVKRLFPEVKLGIGPAIESGFYYDFDFNDCNVQISKEHLKEIESEISNIISENIEIKKEFFDKKRALDIMSDRKEIYKIDLINEKIGENGQISFYNQKEYNDVCLGPHLKSTGCIGNIALTNLTGAYWKGDAKNKMLTRIYGISFPNQTDLENYLTKLEEAKKRDHNKIGRSLKYFTTVDSIGQGLPILLPKGAKVVQLLQRFIEDLEEKNGYLLTKTPYFSKSELYKISGHWSHYQDSMFLLKTEDGDSETYALRPMTCPFQFQVYLNEDRSYRDLPMRFNETSTLFRKEQSGEMHGLTRLRQFTISEGHLACTPEQLDEEFTGCLNLANYCLELLGLERDVTFRFSKWDKNNKEKYIGSEKDWEDSQEIMRKILDSQNLNYTEADGEAAFYGPKLDIQFTNVYNKEDTLITIQIDFQLARRFEMKYTDASGEKKYPFVIHRTSLGCYERTLALLIEKYAGAMPMWLAPEQVRILPVNENLINYSQELKTNLENFGIKRIKVDTHNEKIGYKIRAAQEEKIPYMLVIGNKEVETSKISVRHRTNGDLGLMSLSDFVKLAVDEIENKTIN
ncbi:MAG: threonine--tRNA ligase [Candidatus Improbicoccus devescovinae]|nr:MAG: threonine--tRNA ligase [Candidatus Improbicoccus devescovinae]